MKKVVLILILAVCLVFPSAVLLSGCGKKPINVSNQTFKFDSVKVEWAKGTSGADKSSILAKYNKGTEKESSYTLTLADETKTLLQSDGNTSPNNNSWIEYVADKGWNI